MVTYKIIYLFLLYLHITTAQNMLPNNGLRKILSEYQRGKRNTNPDEDSELSDRDIFIKKIITDLRHHMKKIDDGINSIENNVNFYNETTESSVDVTEIPTNCTTIESVINNNLTLRQDPVSIISKHGDTRKIHIIKEASISGLLGFPNFNQHKEIMDDKSIWSKWSEWTPCSTTCGLGKQLRFRECEGDICEANVEIGARPCNLTNCHPKLIFNFND